MGVGKGGWVDVGREGGCREGCREGRVGEVEGGCWEVLM